MTETTRGDEAGLPRFRPGMKPPYFLPGEEAGDVITSPAVDISLTIYGSDGRYRNLSVDPRSGFIYVNSRESEVVLVLGQIKGERDFLDPDIATEAMAELGVGYSDLLDSPLANVTAKAVAAASKRSGPEKSL